MIRCALFISLIQILLLSTAVPIAAQEINFEDYYLYNLDMQELTQNDLDFEYVVSNGGTYSIDLSNAKTISITGVKYLDVMLEVSATQHLYLNGNEAHAGNAERTIPFTLQAAYANNGQNSLGDVRLISMTGNHSVFQFPILRRQNQPPGPPPPPPTEGFDQTTVEETAYLYLYGTINVGEVDAGSYSTTITVTINYD